MLRKEDFYMYTYKIIKSLTDVGWNYRKKPTLKLPIEWTSHRNQLSSQLLCHVQRDQREVAPADCLNWGKSGLLEYKWKESFLGWFVGLSCRYSRFLSYPLEALFSSVQNIIFLTAHFFTLLVPNPQQPRVCWPLLASVAHFVFLRDDWIRIERAALASRRATYLTYLPNLATHHTT
jgi:hypothetical protein